MAEGARLESVYTATYRGFESLPHRHIKEKAPSKCTGLFLLYPVQGGLGSNPRFDKNARSIFERRAVSGGPQGEGLGSRGHPHGQLIRLVLFCLSVLAFLCLYPYFTSH